MLIVGVAVADCCFCWLSAVGCRMQAVGCQMSLSVVVFGSWLSAVVCRVLVIDCRYRLSLTFSIVGAQLCL